MILGQFTCDSFSLAVFAGAKRTAIDFDQANNIGIDKLDKVNNLTEFILGRPEVPAEREGKMEMSASTGSIPDVIQ